MPSLYNELDKRIDRRLYKRFYKRIDKRFYRPGAPAGDVDNTVPSADMLDETSPTVRSALGAS